VLEPACKNMKINCTERLDDNSVRVVVGLHLGVPVCGPHSCHHCGSVVDRCLGELRHALSSRRSKGRHQCHAAVNEIIHMSLFSARVHMPGLVRSDGHFCSNQATTSTGEVAAQAKVRKSAKYAALPITGTHSFVPRPGVY
jgi:hypothetical protein